LQSFGGIIKKANPPVAATVHNAPRPGCATQTKWIIHPLRKHRKIYFSKQYPPGPDENSEPGTVLLSDQKGNSAFLLHRIFNIYRIMLNHTKHKWNIYEVCLFKSDI